MMAKLIDEKFALELTDAAKTHNEWLAILRFGMDTLIQDQPLLFEIMIRQAHRITKEQPFNDALKQIFDELGLKLTVTADRAGSLATNEDRG